jgi:phage tail sheath gpL-like
MSVIDDTSLAFARGVGAINQTFSFSGQNVESKILVAAPYDPLKTTVVDDVPVLILNEADAGDKAGYGWPAHRLLKAVLKGTNGAGSVYWSPQADAGGAVVADGEIAWTGTTSAAGTIYLRIANELYAINIPSNSTIEETSDAVVAFVNAVADCPVVATKTAVTFETVLTAKAKGAFGNDISITLSADQRKSPAEALPAGLSAVITDMANGVGLPDIADTLTGMGIDGTDDVNEQGFTHLIHMNGIDTTTMDAIQAYVGSANDFTGCWSKLVNRPFVSLTCDTTPGSAGLTALLVITDARLTNQAVGILGVPDEDEIPSEIAGLAAGIIGRIHQNAPVQNYSEQVLSGIGKRSTSANRWTNDYSAGRDFAVKNGISPTDVINTEVQLQNVITMYRPATIPTASNGWSSFVSFFKELNITRNFKLLYSGAAYKGANIVANKALVTNGAAAAVTVDIDDVWGDLVGFIDNYLVPNGLIFDGNFAKANSTVAIRVPGNGFDVQLRDYESGELQIMNLEQIFDKNIAAVA